MREYKENTSSRAKHENHILCKSLCLAILGIVHPTTIFAGNETVALPGTQTKTIAENLVGHPSGTSTASPPHGTADAGNATTTRQVRTYDLAKLAEAAANAYPSVMGRRAELDATKADVKAARWEFFPTPSIRKEIDNRKNTSDTTVYAIQQPLWTAGRLTAGLDAAKARFLAANHAVAEIQYETALRVSAAYRSWLTAKGRSDAFSRSVARHERYLQSISRRAAGGVSADVDIELVVARLSQLRSDLAVAQSSQTTALAQLSLLTGLALEDAAISRGEMVREKPPSVEDVLAAALENFPQLRRLEQEKEAARANVAQKKSSLWPSLSLRAEHVRGTDVFAADTSADNRILLQIDYSPGAGLSRMSDSEAAQARARGVGEARKAAELDLVNQIRADHDVYTSGLQQEKLLRRTRQASEGILESYDRQYRVGRRGWVDVMNAARELSQIETAVADIHAMLVVTRFRLHLYQGNLPWREEDLQ